MPHGLVCLGSVPACWGVPCALLGVPCAGHHCPNASPAPAHPLTCSSLSIRGRKWQDCPLCVNAGYTVLPRKGCPEQLVWEIFLPLGNGKTLLTLSNLFLYATGCLLNRGLTMEVTTSRCPCKGKGSCKVAESMLTRQVGKWDRTEDTNTSVWTGHRLWARVSCPAGPTMMT